MLGWKMFNRPFDFFMFFRGNDGFPVPSKLTCRHETSPSTLPNDQQKREARPMGGRLRVRMK